jgi:hypothetical protein
MSSTKYNQLYGNPALNRALGNIAKTLVGSATDDAAIARANYLDSQTQGQDLKNKNVTDLRASIPQATSVLANSILGATTGNPDAQFNQSGVPIVDGGNMSMPVSGRIGVMPPANMTQENYQGTARAMLGDLGYTPNQFAKAIQNLGGAETAKLAQGLISGGNADEQQRGFKLLGKSPGQFFNPQIAEQKLQNDLEAKNFKTKTDAGVDERVGMNKNKLEANVKRIVGLDKNQKVDATARYKHDNRDISIAVGKDKQVVVDKATGEKLGIEPQTVDGKEIYVFDGRQTIDKIEVKVGKADVYMSKERADKLGIPVNDQGQYVIKGSGYKDGTSGSGDTNLIKGNLIKVFDNEFKKYADYEKFPGKIKTKFQKILQGLVEDKVKQDNESFQQSFIKVAAPIIGMGTTEITVGTNFFMPTYFYKNFKMQMLNQNNPKPQSEVLEDLQEDLGFTKDQADRIIEQMLNE